jgi:hypothetical protein
MGHDCCCADRHGKKRGFVESVADLTRSAKVSVVRGERLVTIDLGALASRRIGAGNYVCLADVWTASQLPGDLVDLVFDFVAEDGFRPSRAHPCVGGTTFARGFLHRGRRDVLWDEALAMPCAFRVKRVALIVADDAA